MEEDWWHFVAGGRDVERLADSDGIEQTRFGVDWWGYRRLRVWSRH